MCQRNQWSLKIYQKIYQAQRLLQNKISLSTSFNGGSLDLYPRHLMEVLFHPENVFIVSKSVLKFLLLFHSHQIIFLMPVYTCYWVSIECIRRACRWTIGVNNVWEMLVVRANVFLCGQPNQKSFFHFLIYQKNIHGTRFACLGRPLVIWHFVHQCFLH